MKTNLDWQQYFDIADKDLPFDEKLDAYAKIAMDRMNAEEFYEFCETHLGHLDEVALEFFGTDTVHDAIRQKVEALYPKHEIDEFTELFWNRIQSWRQSSDATLADG